MMQSTKEVNMMNYRVYLPPYIVPEMPDLSQIDEPQIYPYPQGLLPDGREDRATLEEWKLIWVSWNIVNRPKPNLSRYYFSYIDASKNITVPGKSRFTGYALFETRYDKEIHGYAEPEEMWGIDKWAYKGQLSGQGKNDLALKLLLRHWEHRKKEDNHLGWYRRFHNTWFYKEERLFNNQLREIARWVWF